MKLSVPYCLILIFLCATFTVKAQDSLSRADSLFEIGEYSKAGLAYEWILYSNEEVQNRSQALWGRVQCYKKLGLYEEASKYIDRINLNNIDINLRNRLLYESLLFNYLEENFQEVSSRFLMIRNLIRNTDHFDDAFLLSTLSKFKTGDWEKASEYAEEYIRIKIPETETTLYINEFRTLFKPDEAPKDKNPRTARILSMIIPGSGQIYAGYPLDGFSSFSLHLLAAGGAVISFMNGLYVTGWTGGFGILQKLYFGGNHRAADLAERKSRLNKEHFIQPALEFLVRISDENQ